MVPGLKGKHSHSGTNNGCRVWVSGCLGQLGLTAGWNIMEKVVHGHLGIYLEAVERVACLVLASCLRAHVRFLYGLGVGFDVERFTW